MLRVWRSHGKSGVSLSAQARQIVFDRLSCGEPLVDVANSIGRDPDYVRMIFAQEKKKRLPLPVLISDLERTAKVCSIAFPHFVQELPEFRATVLLVCGDKDATTLAQLPVFRLSRTQRAKLDEVIDRVVVEVSS